jgi:hypothetical protein
MDLHVYIHPIPDPATPGAQSNWNHMEQVSSTKAEATQDTVLRVAAISGSLRRASANTGLLRAGNNLLPVTPGFYSCVWLLLNTVLDSRSRGDLQGLHPGAAGGPRRHLGPAPAEHGPRGGRRLSGGRGGVPRQGARGRLLPPRLARVQLFHVGPAEERPGLGVAPAQLLRGQGGRDPERVGRLRRQPLAVPHPPGRGIPRHPLPQQAGGVHQGAPAPREVRRRRQPRRPGDQGTARRHAALAASVRPQAPAGGETVLRLSFVKFRVYFLAVAARDSRHLIPE